MTDFYNKKSNKNIKTILLNIFFPLYSLSKKHISISNHRKKYNGKTICVCGFTKRSNNKTDICIELYNYLKKYRKQYDICFIKQQSLRTKYREIIIPKHCDQLFNYRDIGYDAKLLSNYADTFLVKNINNINYSNKNYDYIIFDDYFLTKNSKLNKNIVVFDEKSFIGNGYYFPAGPVITNLKKLKNADFAIIVNNTLEKNMDRKMREVEILTNYISIEKILYAELVIKNVSRKKTNTKYFAFSCIDDDFEHIIKHCNMNIVGFHKILSKKRQKYSKDNIYRPQLFVNMINHLDGNDKIKLITSKKDYEMIPNYLIDKFNIEYLQTEYKIEKVDLIFDFNTLK